MDKNKHVPLRMCIACRNMKPKEELIKLCISPDGFAAIDRSGKSTGRGAYICKSEECIKKAQKAGKIERALKCNVSSEIYEVLKTECNA